MIVSTKENEIVIHDVADEAKSQLSFWKFKKSDEGFLVVQAENLGTLLKKVVDYFDKESLKYSLTDEAGEVLKNRQDSLTEFENKKITLSSMKEGKLDKELYAEFDTFLDRNISRPLKDHQKKSAFHLYLAKNGANFSAPGSGKTSVVLSVFEKLRQEGVVDTLFVIGPPSSFGSWRREFEATLGHAPKFTVLSGAPRETRAVEYYPTSENRSELYLSTYHTTLNDQNEMIRFFSSLHVKAFLVVDEAHYMKRLNGNWANSVLRLAEFASVRCVLTGTPLPKSYSDLFNLFDFLWPNHKPISEELQNRILLLEKDKQFDKIKPLLDSTVGPLFYRVRKRDLNLTEQDFRPPQKIKMNPIERRIYDAIENKIREYDANDDIHDFELVLHLRRGRLMRLRQAASYIGLLETVIEGYKETLYDPASDIGKYIHRYDSFETPAKLEHLVGLVRELNAKGEKVLIWTNFIRTISLIRKKLEDAGFRTEQITGDTPVEREGVELAGTREKIRDDFMDPQSGLDILIANPAACAESISLHTGCHNAVYYDLSYNCAQYLQSLDRIHRVGGSETVVAHYHFLEYKDTIDEDVRENLERKARQMYEVIDEDYPIYSIDLSENDDLSAYERIFKN